ncbi:alpha/beta hydrolase-fold protein, partial [Tritonibacter sp. SIMBA_163]|uniref:alpha/beta hydrolase-fold protein n=1 Tax=Tritonibacter sp. SIMBA_163 TaxID=3080868 RepID=UPI00397F6937
MPRFLLEDVRSFVAATVRVTLEHQGVFGHSFGGLFALWLLNKNPKAVSHWIAASPAITWEGSFLLDKLSRF